MDRRRSLIAVALCAFMVFSLFVSSALIAREAAHHHVCAGENCPVCQFIAQIERLLRGFGMLLLALLLACLVLALRREWRARMTTGIPALCTPVGRKIRLND